MLNVRQAQHKNTINSSASLQHQVRCENAPEAHLAVLFDNGQRRAMIARRSWNPIVIAPNR